MEQRPSSTSVVGRFAVAAACLVGAGELVYRWSSEGVDRDLPPVIAAAVAEMAERWAPVRVWGLANTGEALALGLGGTLLLLLAYRSALILWRNQVVPRVAGT